MPHNNPPDSHAGLELRGNDTFPVSSGPQTGPFANEPDPARPVDSPTVQLRTLAHKRLAQRRKSPVAHLLSGSFWILKAWQLDIECPAPLSAWLDQRLSEHLTENFGMTVDLDALHIDVRTEDNPAVDINGDEHFDLRLSLRQLVRASTHASSFTALQRCAEPKGPVHGAPVELTVEQLFKLLMSVNWVDEHEALSGQFWARHLDTWQLLAKLSFLDHLNHLQQRKKISADGYRLALDAMGLTDFPKTLEQVHDNPRPRRSTVQGVTLNDEAIPGIFHMRSHFGHCFIHMLGDRASCCEYICDDAPWQPQKVLDALNASPWHRQHLDLSHASPRFELSEPIADLFLYLGNAQQQFSTERLWDADFLELAQDISADEEDLLLAPIRPALALISALDHWHDEAQLLRRIPTLLGSADKLMGKWLQQDHAVAIDPQHVFVRYLRGHAIRPWGHPRIPANHVLVVPDEQPIALGQALVQNFRAHNPMGYEDHGGRWVVYSDGSGEGVWSEENVLSVSATQVEAQIRSADFPGWMADRLRRFWDRQGAASEQRLLTTFIGQALFSLKTGDLSAAAFNLLVTALEEDHTPGKPRKTCWSALGFYLPNGPLASAHGPACPGLLFLRHRDQPGGVLYQAGQQQAFLEFSSRQPLIEHLCRCAADEHWRETLLNYMPLRFQSSLSYILQLWGGVKRPPEPVSRLRPWTDVIYTEAVHKARARELAEHDICGSPIAFLLKHLRQNSLDDADDSIVTDRELVIDYWTQQLNRLQVLLAPMAFFLPPAAIATLTASAASLALNLQAANLPGYREAERRQVMVAILSLGLLQLAPATPRLLRAFGRFSAPDNLFRVARTVAPLRNFGIWLQRATHSRRSFLDRFFNGAGPLKNWHVAGNAVYGTQPVRVWKLGKKFLLWTSDQSQARTLVVSSHGYYLPWTRTTAVPNGTELRTYAPHGYELVDPGLHKVASQAIKPYALLNDVQSRPGPGIGPFPDLNEANRLMGGTSLPGQIKNYSLSKFQSDSYESYRDISHIVRNTQQPPLPTSLPAAPMDVLTVRNRFGMNSPTLQDLFAQLHHHGIHYDRILLVHCRCSAISSLLGRSPKYSAAQGTAPITP
nr:DUF6543 domain-containing protein [uncultured Pseudomonas sp.]